MSLFKNLRGGMLVGIGYLLSPLSWWNDLFFNFPIALVFGYGVSWLHPQWFLPGIIVGYWLSNVLGMIMIQLGAIDLFIPNGKTNHTRDIVLGFGSATLYTILVAALIYFHVLDLPDFIKDLRS